MWPTEETEHMISEAELRRQAARWQVDPMVANLDYSLGWFLAAFFSTDEAVGFPLQGSVSPGGCGRWKRVSAHVESVDPIPALPPPASVSGPKG
jgi:hypothetical protein